MWWKFASDLAAASLEAHRVVALRSLRLAKGGPQAQKEASKMVNEKLIAAMEASMTLASGGSPDAVLRRYRTTMRANAKRLSKLR